MVVFTTVFLVTGGFCVCFVGFFELNFKILEVHGGVESSHLNLPG